jgi:hypothetical protein
MSAYAYYPTANSGGGTDVALSVGLVAYPATSAPSGSGIPKAYIKYIFFSKNNMAVGGGQKLITTTANTTWEVLPLSYIAAEDGYLQVMVVNESAARC